MRSYAVVLVALLAGSCRDVVGPAIDEFRLPDISDAVAGAARDALDGTGRFVPRQPWSASTEPIIGPEFAQAIGRVYLRDAIVSASTISPGGNLGFRSIRDAIEAAWCRRIDWNKVRLADHWFYGVPPTDVPVDPLPQRMLRSWGPKYFLPILHGRDWIATVAVAAHATNVSIRDGRIHTDGPIAGGEFTLALGHCNLHAGTPPAAEEAVAFAAAQARRRIIEVPTLTTPGVSFGVGGARWRLVLDAPVTVKSIADGSLSETEVLYVSAWPNPTETGLSSGTTLYLSIPAPTQPDYEVIDEMHFPRRPGVPLHFVGVTVVHGVAM